MRSENVLIRGAWLAVVTIIFAACSGNNNPTYSPRGDDAPADISPWVAANGPDAADSTPPLVANGPDAADTTPPVVANGPDAAESSPVDIANDRDAADAATPLVSDVAVEAPRPAACGTGLAGTAPFGAKLSGTGSFTSLFGSDTSAPITRTMNAYIYFPAGRVAGAPVQLAFQSLAVATQHFFGPQVTLASDLSATGLTVGGHDMQITGDLQPGSGGLQATISANFADAGGDVADDRTGSVLMCPAGEVPAPALQVSAGILSPLSTLALNSTTPLTAEAISGLRISSPLGAVAFTVSGSGGSPTFMSQGPNFTVKASSAFPPGRPLTFDASAVKDVLGRQVPLSVAGTQVLTTTAVPSDLSFSKTPPTGAIACSVGCKASAFSTLDGGARDGMLQCTGGDTVANGLLKIVNGGPYAGANVDALLALPPTSATKLRVRMAVGDVVDAGSGCFSGFGQSAWNTSIRTGIAAVVGPNGEASANVSLACDGTMADHVIDLPNASPLWLVVHIEGYTRMPYYSPVPGPPSASIDEVEFM